jgi:hypothetical protein
MRPGPNPKRQRGRNNQRRHGGGGGGGGGNPRNQTFESNGPEVKIRGNAHQVLERYLALARDASSSGDRVTAENYYQHAEHYYRLLSAQAAQQAQMQGGPNSGRPGFPGMGPQPELPSVSDQPEPDEDEFDDGYVADRGNTYNQPQNQNQNFNQNQNPNQNPSQNQNQNQNQNRQGSGPGPNGGNGSHSTSRPE